jgi:hypothetical protein
MKRVSSRADRKKVTKILLNLKREGLTAPELASRLNQGGFVTRQGLEWTDKHVSNFLAKNAPRARHVTVKPIAMFKERYKTPLTRQVDTSFTQSNQWTDGFLAGFKAGISVRGQIES